MLPEAELKDDGSGLVPASHGWFVMNARDARWFHRPGRGDNMLLVEGQERQLKQWDFVHCPPETRHAFVGAGDGPCVLLAMSSRHYQKDGPWGVYCAGEVASRYSASAPEGTQDGDVAYARFRQRQPTRCRDGLLPD
jgi:mannose-6-phosphate isomerase-like protein (cupin superfamily)